MGRYTLHLLEKLTGIPGATIRVWERRYKIISPKRTRTNRRWYNDEDLKRLINISVLYQNGIKISKIAQYSVSELEEKARLLISGSGLPDAYIKSLTTAMLSFNGNAVNEVLLRSIISNGFEDTFSNVVFPFLRRVGIMWHTGSAGAGAEHFITNIFRGKLISATDSLPQTNNPEIKRVIMFLPENELHELGLLFYAYLIRKMGHEILYLGQTTPIHALNDVNEKWTSDILVTGTLSGLSAYTPDEYLKDLSSIFKTQKILVSGSLADNADITRDRNIFPVRSADDLKSHFAKA